MWASRRASTLRPLMAAEPSREALLGVWVDKEYGYDNVVWDRDKG